MKLSRLEYSSLLTYCPRGHTEEMQKAINARYAIKFDRYVDNPQILMSQWIAKIIAKNKEKFLCGPSIEYYR